MSDGLANICLQKLATFFFELYCVKQSMIPGSRQWGDRHFRCSEIYSCIPHHPHTHDAVHTTPTTHSGTQASNGILCINCKRSKMTDANNWVAILNTHFGHKFVRTTSSVALITQMEIMHSNNLPTTTIIWIKFQIHMRYKKGDFNVRNLDEKI